MLFLCLLFAGWCLLRVLTWQNPWPEELTLPSALHFAGGEGAAMEAGPVTSVVTAENALSGDGPTAMPAVAPMPWRGLDDALPVTFAAEDFTAHFDTHRRAMGHNLLFAAGMASLPMPRSLTTVLDEAPGAARTISRPAPEVTPSPWRFDGWIALREGGALLTGSGSRPSSYGASQLGAVLAYRLAPASPRVPAAYVRISHALAADGETDAALGLRARPLAAIPLTLHAEARLTQGPARATEIRPAVFVAGGVESLPLPARINARFYGQAGYVGGRFATAFADGALVAERDVARFELGEVSLGAGVWGGAQRDAARLDLGPSVSLKVELGGAPARIAADYRWRVAGDAEPGNGGVLTVSTGF